MIFNLSYPQALNWDESSTRPYMVFSRGKEVRPSPPQCQNHVCFCFFYLLVSKQQRFDQSEGLDAHTQTPYAWAQQRAVHLFSTKSSQQKKMSKNRHAEVRCREQNEQSGTLGGARKQDKRELKGVGVKRREQDLA